MPLEAIRQKALYFTTSDHELLLALAGCTLNEKPGKNWVENEGGLPEYICRIARAIKRRGSPTGRAISIAVATVKRWAAGVGDVNADTRAKAAAAVAEWEKLKAKAKVKQAVKTGRRVLATAAQDSSDMLVLADSSFNVDKVRKRFYQAMQNDLMRGQDGFNEDDPNNPPVDDSEPRAWFDVQEMWNDFLIVRSDDHDLAFKIPYTVEGDEVQFGEPIEIKQEWVEVPAEAKQSADGSGASADGSGASGGAYEPTDEELRQIVDGAVPDGPMMVMAMLSSTDGTTPLTPLDRIRRSELALAPRQFSTNVRKKLADAGEALPDGSYPIPDRGALGRAIRAFGRAPADKRDEVKAHIKKRARALGATWMLPKGW